MRTARRAASRAVVAAPLRPAAQTCLQPETPRALPSRLLAQAVLVLREIASSPHVSTSSPSALKEEEKTRAKTSVDSGAPRVGLPRTEPCPVASRAPAPRRTKLFFSWKNICQRYRCLSYLTRMRSTRGHASRCFSHNTHIHLPNLGNIRPLRRESKNAAECTRIHDPLHAVQLQPRRCPSTRRPGGPSELTPNSLSLDRKALLTPVGMMTDGTKPRGSLQ